MIKPRVYRRFYRDLKLFERNKDLIVPMALVEQSVKGLSFRQKLYVFFKVLFK